MFECLVLMLLSYSVTYFAIGWFGNVAGGKRRDAPASPVGLCKIELRASEISN